MHVSVGRGNPVLPGTYQTPFFMSNPNLPLAYTADVNQALWTPPKIAAGTCRSTTPS